MFLAGSTHAAKKNLVMNLKVLTEAIIIAESLWQALKAAEK